MLKILTVVGARPQFIKAATISRVVGKSSGICEVIVHTGQHFDSNMSDVFFSEMEIPQPQYNLNISSLSHGAMTGRMIEGLERIMLDERPDWLLVYGDTNSTLAATIAASKLGIKVAHVEAGLRSNNMNMPEEQNRIITDRLSSLLFCPTAQAVKNLNREGYHYFKNEIIQAGDVMYDAALFYRDRARKPDWIDSCISKGKFILATIHREENTNNPMRLREIISALNYLHSSIPVILPLHPRTRKVIDSLKLKLDVFVAEPVGYLEMMYLLDNCDLVLSDSGGLQKEAYYFRKRCLVLRDETEWTELVESGINTLVGADFKKITAAAKICDAKINFSGQLYGNGNAAELIVSALKSSVDEESILVS